MNKINKIIFIFFSIILVILPIIESYAAVDIYSIIYGRNNKVYSSDEVLSAVFDSATAGISIGGDSLTIIMTDLDSLKASNDTIIQILRYSLSVISTDITTLEQTFKDSISLALQDNDTIIQVLRDSLSTISNDIATFEQTYKDSISLLISKVDSLKNDNSAFDKLLLRLLTIPLYANIAESL